MVVPIEVKGGNTRANSLKSLMKNHKDISYGYKFADGNIGVGVMLLKHFQASLGYNFSLGKTGEFEVENYLAEQMGKNGSKSSGKMNAWQLSVAYFF